MAVQAVSAISMSLPATQANATIYIPEIHRPCGWVGTPEMARSDQTKATIVADIASAQHDDIVRIIAFDLAAGTCWDASTEIADLVLDVVLAENEGIPAWCEDFLETHLGINRVREAEYEYRHAA